MLELARVHSLLGNDAEVERYFLRCAELNPRRAALYRAQIGWFFQRKKRWARALLWYDQALETFPGYHLCLFRKGYCLERLHRPREAASALEQAVAAFEQATPEQRERGRGIQIQVLFHLARNLREIGETDRARAALDRCAALDDRPREPVIKPEHRLASYGETFLRDGAPEEALAYLERARERDPSSSVIWERLGRAYEAAGRRAEAEAAYRRATELPKGAVALVSLARFLLRANRLEEGARCLIEALERHPAGEVQIRLEVARLHHRLGRPRAALEELDRLAEGRVPPRSTLAAAIDLAMADILLEHGRAAEALPRLRAAAEQHPEDAPLQQRLSRLERELEGRAGEDPPPLRDRPLPARLRALRALEPERHAGRVASYFPERGFGFIRYGDERTVFFHVSHFRSDTGAEIAPGTEVSFVIGKNHRTGRPQAEQIRSTRGLARAAAATGGSTSSSRR